jgi:hypothetical protein
VADLRQVQNALELYYAKNSAYPPGSLSDWDDFSSELINAGIGVVKIAKDPTAGQTYYYLTDSFSQSYVVAARLEVAESSLFSDSYTDPITDFSGTNPPPVDCNSPFYCIRF